VDAAAYRKFRVLSQYVAQLRAELAVLGLHEGRDFGLKPRTRASIEAQTRAISGRELQ
jgi:hypothetical protein